MQQWGTLTSQLCENFLSDWNNIKPIEIKAPTYLPANESIEETPPPNFEKPVDPNLFKDLGSLLATTRKDYQK